MAMDARDEARIKALLRIDSYGADVEPTDPDPDPDDLGAESAVGYAWAAEQVRASVFRFAGYAEASEAEEQLASVGADDVVTRSTVNGGLLLWVTGVGDSAPGLVRDLVSSFAGEE